MSEISDSDLELYDSQHYEDLDSCLGYLKKREVFLYKMMNDPNHKAMLYFLEVLLNSDHQLTIDELVDKFYCKNFTEDMRIACGNNAQGLKKFLECYPSLFRVKGNYVSAVAIDVPNSVSLISNCSSPSSTSQCNNTTNATISSDNTETEFTCSKISKLSLKFPQKFDFNMEIEAVKFFQSKLLKRDEKWILIKSLAGHLSQADINIREVVGPQVEFRKFLLRHPHVFEVQGELVSLKDNFPSQCLNRKPKPINGFTNKSVRPKSLNVSSTNTQRDFFSATSAPTTPVAHSNGLHVLARSAPLSMSGNEYRAIMFLRKVIEKKNGSLSLSHLFLYLGKASETIRNIIGWTKFELQEFIRKNSVFFDTTPNEMVLNKKANRINVIITGTSNSCDPGTRTLTNRCGNVFHVAKLWGIIDLGRHEHVFFDKSIFRHLDDLQRHFKIGETLYFNAILAPKESRAKWRATQVWKESDREMVEKFSGNILSRATTNSGINNDCLSDANSIITDASDDLTHYDNSEGQNNLKLLPEDVEEELTRILKLTKTDCEDDDDYFANFEKFNKKDILIEFNKPFKNNAGKLCDIDYDDDTQSIESIPTPDFSSQLSVQSEPSIASHPLSAPAASSDHYTVLQTTPSNKKSVFIKVSTKNSEESKLPQPDIIKRPKMISTATQTLSTGDIMATNLFHEGMSQMV